MGREVVADVVHGLLTLFRVVVLEFADLERKRLERGTRNAPVLAVQRVDDQRQLRGGKFVELAGVGVLGLVRRVHHFQAAVLGSLSLDSGVHSFLLLALDACGIFGFGPVQKLLGADLRFELDGALVQAVQFLGFVVVQVTTDQPFHGLADFRKLFAKFVHCYSSYLRVRFKNSFALSWISLFLARFAAS